MIDPPDRGPGLDPVPGRPEAALFGEAVAWRYVTEELDVAAAATAALAAAIGASWADLAGQAWRQRLTLVGRELERQSGVAADIVRALTALADGVGGDQVAAAEQGRAGSPGPVAHGPDRGHEPAAPAPGPPGGTAPSWTLPGARLGGIDGGRANERRGVVVPTLPEQPG